MVLKTIVTGAYKPTNITGGPHIVILIDINVTEKMPTHVIPLKKHGPFRVNWRDLPYMAYLSGLGDMPPESGLLVNSDDED
jgi:hypothetical protein